jgi:hypothetical protein
MDSQQMMELLLKELRAYGRRNGSHPSRDGRRAKHEDEANMNACGLPRDGGASRRGKADLSGQEA